MLRGTWVQLRPSGEVQTSASSWSSPAPAARRPPSGVTTSETARPFFRAGASTLARRADCVISVKLPGLDLVVEGSARKVTDEATLQRLAERYAAQGWPATVEDGAFPAPYSAPSAGPPPWDLNAFTPETAFGVASAEPYGATRWRFHPLADTRATSVSR